MLKRKTDPIPEIEEEKALIISLLMLICIAIHSAYVQQHRKDSETKPAPLEYMPEDLLLKAMFKISWVYSVKLLSHVLNVQETLEDKLQKSFIRVFCLRPLCNPTDSEIHAMYHRVCKFLKSNKRQDMCCRFNDGFNRLYQNLSQKFMSVKERYDEKKQCSCTPHDPLSLQDLIDAGRDAISFHIVEPDI